MRNAVVFVLAPALIIALAGCHRRPPAGDNPANAVSTADADSPDDPNMVSNQTMEQVLARTMNRFARLDLNGDGKLTEEELNAATSGGDHSDGDVQHPRQGYSVRAFAGADANGDGVVTRQEAESQARARFKRLDANGDGRLSKDELAAGRETRNAQAGSEQ